MNVMKEIRVEKVTLNIGSGKDQNKLEKAMVVLKTISGVAPNKRTTQKRIASWGLRPGLPIGCMVTLRKEKAVKLLPKLLSAKENILEKRHFDVCGNISFGIQEHIDVEEVEYDPKIGVVGLQVCVTLERPGYSIKRRRIRSSAIGKKHIITKQEAIEFMKKKYNTILKGVA